MQFLKRLDSRLADEARRLVAETFISEPYLRILCCLCDFYGGQPVPHMFVRRDDALPFLEQVKLVRQDDGLWVLNVRPLSASESPDRLLTWDWKHPFRPPSA